MQGQSRKMISLLQLHLQNHVSLIWTVLHVTTACVHPPPFLFVDPISNQIQSKDIHVRTQLLFSLYLRAIKLLLKPSLGGLSEILPNSECAALKLRSTNKTDTDGSQLEKQAVFSPSLCEYDDLWGHSRKLTSTRKTKWKRGYHRPYDSWYSLSF